MRRGVADAIVKVGQALGHERPYFLFLRSIGPSPLHNLRPATRPAAEKKILDAEAAVMAQALGHRRAGRHFLMELFRGRHTLEGQELLDEPGIVDVSAGHDGSESEDGAVIGR